MNKTSRVIISAILGVIGLVTVGLAAKFLPTIKDESYFGVISYVIPIIYVMVLTSFMGLCRNYTHIDVTGLKVEKRSPWAVGFKWGVLPVALICGVNLFFAVASLGKYGFVPSLGSAVLFMVLTNLCVAFFEESLFRNVIFSLLKGKTQSYKLAFWGSSVLFGLFHMGNITEAGTSVTQVAVQVVYTFMLGVFFCGLMLATKSLLVPIVAHWIIDVTANVNVLYNAPKVQAVASGPDLMSIIIMLLIAMPALVLGIMMYKKYVNMAEAEA